ncbi:hypothetical protein SO802_022579 [Lithocarpus litseifolius]|uniref:Uncharacterized protein n=1 Tax=Lithocarpus litseifolius TaxID=425828 RepID=A0AAW2C5C0_9ROSI
MAETTKNVGTKRIAVVTGANKGLGFAISKQLASNGVKVILTSRDVKRGNEAVEKLNFAGCSDVIFHQLDLEDSSSISSLEDFIETQFGTLDMLVNNAGVQGAIAKDELWKLDFDETHETAENCLRTNYYGIKQLSKSFIPLLLLSNSARIVNVSSIAVQLKNVRKELEDIDGLTEEVDKVVEGFLEDVKENLIETKGWRVNFSAYFVSKAALNAYTRILARKNGCESISKVAFITTGFYLDYEIWQNALTLSSMNNNVCVHP